VPLEAGELRLHGDRSRPGLLDQGQAVGLGRDRIVRDRIEPEAELAAALRYGGGEAIDEGSGAQTGDAPNVDLRA
jgi:hypothetical protein